MEEVCIAFGRPAKQLVVCRAVMLRSCQDAFSDSSADHTLPESNTLGTRASICFQTQDMATSQARVLAQGHMDRGLLLNTLLFTLSACYEAGTPMMSTRSCVALGDQIFGPHLSCLVCAWSWPRLLVLRTAARACYECRHLL